jgi:catechol 2,3-dioxygenase-like lactoylglutathione lyase family enzyme
MAHRILSTLHSGHTVSDVRTLANFFRECFGFAITEPRSLPADSLAQTVGIPGASATVIYVTAPGHVIELLEYHYPSSASPSAGRPCDVGAGHLSFLVENVSDTATAAASYGFSATRGSTVISGGPHQGRRAVYLRDRRGFTIELMGE